MSDQKRTAAQQLDRLLDAYLNDLLQFSDAELLAEAGNLLKEEGAFDTLVDRAKAEAGRRRLERAKRDLGARAPTARDTRPIDIEQAKRYLAQAANDRNITLAARDLRELPDEEIERLYLQLKQLEREQGKDKKG